MPVYLNQMRFKGIPSFSRGPTEGVLEEPDRKCKFSLEMWKEVILYIDTNSYLLREKELRVSWLIFFYKIDINGSKWFHL